MAMKANQVVTGEVRISYEHLLKPYAMRPDQEAKYSVTLLIPKNDTATKAKIDAAIQFATQEGVKNKWKGAQPPVLPVPIHDGDGPKQNGEAYGAECRGHWVVTASSRERQDVVGVDRQPIMDSTQVYSGMYAKVLVTFFAYDAGGKRGIGCGLGPVMKTRDGESLGGRVSADEAFAGEAAPAQSYAPAPGYQPPMSGYQQPAYAPPQQPTYTPPAPVYDPFAAQTGSIAGL